MGEPRDPAGEAAWEGRLRRIKRLAESIRRARQRRNQDRKEEPT
ncbi:hypothetical protein [Kribbella sp. CA-294648]